MKVLVLTDDRVGPVMAGSALRAWELARVLLSAGHDVVVAAASGSRHPEGHGPTVVEDPPWRWAEALVSPPWCLPPRAFLGQRADYWSSFRATGLKVRRRPLFSLESDDDEYLPYSKGRPILCAAVENHAGKGRGNVGDSLVRLDFGQWLINPHRVADLHEPLHYLGLGQALSDVRQPKLLSHLLLQGLSDGGNNPIGRYFGLMFDSMIGGDYETGLAKLKQLAEANSAVE